MQMYNKTTLKNGLRVVSHNMPGMDSVALGIWVNAGGRYEDKRTSGVSHFLEHLLFKGTKTRSTQQIKQAIEGVGGSMNAFTSEEFTCYFIKILAGRINSAIDVLSDMILNATIPPLEIEKERTVIIEEIKMYHDLPSHYVGELLSQLLWPNQPLGRFLAGTFDTIASLKRKDIKEYKDKLYNPRNIIVTVCGKLDHNKLTTKVSGYFSNVKPKSKGQFSPAVIKQRIPRANFYFKETEQTHISLGVHAFSRNHADRFALSLLHIILGANMSSRLFQEVREKYGLAYEIGSQLRRFHDTGAFIVNAGVDNKKVSRAIKVIIKELNKITHKNVAKEELSRAKEFYIGQLLLSLEDTLDHMFWIGEKEASLGRIETADNAISAINKVSVDDIKRAASKLFNPDRLNLALIGPLSNKEKKEIKKIMKN